MNAQQVAVGQKVHCILYGGWDGIIFRITGEQRPETIRSFLGGAGVSGGNSYFDVVFENGGISRGVPEGIVRGIQWEIYDEIATGDEIAKALHFAEQEEARREAEKIANEQRRKREREEHAKNNPHLVKPSDRPNWGSARLVAENIRRELKRSFPGVKFSVKADGNSVDVRWKDGPTSKQVKAFTSRHEAGSFDGMTDSYNYDPDATFADVFGEVRYVFEHRDETIEGVRKAWEMAGRDPSDVPEDWEEGGRWKMKDQNVGQWMFQTWSETDLR